MPLYGFQSIEATISLKDFAVKHSCFALWQQYQSSVPLDYKLRLHKLSVFRWSASHSLARREEVILRCLRIDHCSLTTYLQIDTVLNSCAVTFHLQTSHFPRLPHIRHCAFFSEHSGKSLLLQPDSTTVNATLTFCQENVSQT